MAKPLHANQVQEAKNARIPDEVYDAFNEMILKKWDGHSATFKQDDVVNLVLQKMDKENNFATRQALYADHHLDVEDSYRKNGWEVEYDKPGYNENYDAIFIFKKEKS